MSAPVGSSSKPVSGGGVGVGQTQKPNLNSGVSSREVMESTRSGDWTLVSKPTANSQNGLPIIIRPPTKTTSSTASTHSHESAAVSKFHRIGSDSVVLPTLKDGVKVKKLNRTLPEVLLKRLSSAATSTNNTVTFLLNGELIELVQPDPTLKLADWLRFNQNLTGTKIGCGEGFCGACMVLLTETSPSTGQTISHNVNSCMQLVVQLDGKSITTIEGIGSERTGPHPLQQSVADHAATQCGYCTSGFVMSMYGLLSETSPANPTQQQVENRFDGNICRCTGYRPIFSAMRAVLPPTGQDSSVKSNGGCSKSQATSGSCGTLKPCGKGDGAGCSSDAKSGCAKKGLCCGDVEDLVKFDANNPKHLPHKANPPHPSHAVQHKATNFSSNSETIFITPATIGDAKTMLDYYVAQSETVRLVCGNTSMALAKYYPFNPLYDAPTVYINVAELKDLKAIRVDPLLGLVVGSSVTIAELMAALVSPPSSSASHGHGHSTNINPSPLWSKIADHFTLVANQSVRANGSWTGNLMLAKAHPEFPSDLLTVLSSVGASIVFAGEDGRPLPGAPLPVAQLQSTQFTGNEFFYELHIPFIQSANQSFSSYKTRSRRQCAHPILNSGFLFTYGGKDAQQFPIITQASMAFGGLTGLPGVNGVFTAPKTTALLVGKSLNPTNLSLALASLEAEVTPPSRKKKSDPVDPDLQAFVESLALTTFFKNWVQQLSLIPGYTLPPKDVSAFSVYDRPISSGIELSTPTGTFSPVGEPFPKVEGLAQATGEAKYSNDEIMDSTTGLYGAFVTSTTGAGTIQSIDVTLALNMPGVVRFISAHDIAALGGANDCGAFPGDEEIFASKEVLCMDQAIGMILADTQQHANAAAITVKVTYGPPTITPIYTIDDAVAAQRFLPNAHGQFNFSSPTTCGDIVKGFAESKQVVSFTQLTGGQYHFSLETQSCYAIPGEQNTLLVYSASQGTQTIRQAVSLAVARPSNKVIIKTKRCGGGFGAKLSRSVPIACAVAVAAAVTGRPVKSQCERVMDSVMWGKRPAVRMDNKVGFNANGQIMALNTQFYNQGGYSYEANFGTMFMQIRWAENCYYIPNFNAAGSVCITNTPSNTSMRAPGQIQAVLNTEMIIERIAFETGLTPDAVRSQNYYQEGQTTPYGEVVSNITLPAVIATLQQQSNYLQLQAEVAQFNAANRWRKRGIRMSTLKYGIQNNSNYNQTMLLLSFCQEDGTVQVTHSGIEIGQGINTKVIQAIAFELSKLSDANLPPLTIDKIHVNGTDSSVVANGSQTGGSTGSECCTAAAQLAAVEMVSRLAPVQAALNQKGTPATSWAKLIAEAAAAGNVNLQVSSQYFMPFVPTAPFTYYVWCAAVSQVELDILTGEVQISNVDIVYDAGESLNPTVDIGQIEGGFVLGLGHVLMEDLIYSPTTGETLSKGAFEYPVPSSLDIPIKFNVTLLDKVQNSATGNIYLSKATAEPPVTLAVSTYLALRQCIAAARADVGHTEWFDLPIPATTERIQTACLVNRQNLTL